VVLLQETQQPNPPFLCSKFHFLQAVQFWQRGVVSLFPEHLGVQKGPLGCVVVAVSLELPTMPVDHNPAIPVNG
jgi:hypothetical protein